MKIFVILAAAFAVTASAPAPQQNQYTTPVPILKQINKHNEDGSYSYGYEAADGTFKIETKYPNGEVYGKYGYVDDSGKLREVEYGASRRGFEPTGNEIQVPPPTLQQNANNVGRALGPNEEDDGQYREDPAQYYKNEPFYSQPRAYQPQPQPAYQPQPQPAFRPQPQPYVPQQPQYNVGLPAGQPRYYNPQPYQPAPPAYPGYNAFQGHPASNVDIVSGSYSVNYRR